MVLCSYEDCRSKTPLTEGELYCKTHSKIVFLETVEKQGKKPCYNHIRGCRSILDIDYTKSRCPDCLQKEREKDKKKREAVPTIVVSVGEKVCSTCCKTYPLDQYKGVKEGTVTKTCLVCREQNKINEAKRDKEHRRENARKNEAKPECRERKQKWRDDNYEKATSYWMKTRENKLNELGVEGYLKYNAEQAKKWREKNKDKMEEANENKINSMECNYGVYKRSANDKNLEFTITEEEYSTIVIGECRYCGGLQERGFNGIDRIDSKFGYTLENCVSCCKMCNYMKLSISENVFLQRVEHILTYNGVIENGNLYHSVFQNYNGSSFNYYKNRAKNKNLSFELDETTFSTIRFGNCYLCGKKTDENHKNGIDRVNNELGYVEGNVQTCCGNCNYMKRDYNLDDFMNKLKEIYIYVNTKGENVVIIDRNVELKNIVKGNKKSKEEKEAIQKERKERKREELVKRYSDEDIKKERIQKLVEIRNSKINRTLDSKDKL
jgi:hypothetical protein